MKHSLKNMFLIVAHSQILILSSKENLPRVDASLAIHPLVNSLAVNFLNMKEEDVEQAFLYWQDLGLVNVLNGVSFEIRYLPLKNALEGTRKFSTYENNQKIEFKEDDQVEVNKNYDEKNLRYYLFDCFSHTYQP